MNEIVAHDMLERRKNPVGRAATANIPRITLGGLRLAVLDCEQTANFMLGMVFPERRLPRPLYLTSANGEVLARCSTEPMTDRLFRAADLINADGQQMYAINVRLDNGEYRTVVQDSVVDLRTGNRVRIVDGRVYRY